MLAEFLDEPFTAAVRKGVPPFLRWTTSGERAGSTDGLGSPSRDAFASAQRSGVPARAAIAFGCWVQQDYSGRVRAGGEEAWCPIGMQAPGLSDDLHWTDPTPDMLGMPTFFSTDAVSADCRARDECRDKVRNLEAMLAAFGEPVLPHADSGMAAVRVVYTHGFPYRPLNMIRAVRTEAGSTLTAKVLEAREPAGQGRLMWMRTSKLSAQDWAAVVAKLQAKTLWDAPTVASNVEDFGGCGHPLCYTIELIQNTKQHVLHECPCWGNKRGLPLAELLTDLARCPPP
jgi:hypothetical protein